MHFGNYSPRSFGWAEPKAAEIVPFRFNGVSFPGGVHRTAEPLFREALRLIVAHLPGGLKAGTCWGYTHRKVTGGEGLSFHAYGLALDVNAPDNPYVASGRPYRHTMPNNTGELVRGLGMEWGGSWTKPKDYMHIEFHGTPAETEAIASRLLQHRAAAAPPVAHVQKPKPGQPATPGHRVVRLGSTGDDVRFIQRWIGSKWCGAADGVYGPTTEAGVKRYQQMRGLVADGIVGPATWHQLGVR